MTIHGPLPHESGDRHRDTVEMTLGGVAVEPEALRHPKPCDGRAGGASPCRTRQPQPRRSRNCTKSAPTSRIAKLSRRMTRYSVSGVPLTQLSRIRRRLGRRTPRLPMDRPGNPVRRVVRVPRAVVDVPSDALSDDRRTRQLRAACAGLAGTRPARRHKRLTAAPCATRRMSPGNPHTRESAAPRAIPTVRKCVEDDWDLHRRATLHRFHTRLLGAGKDRCIP